MGFETPGDQRVPVPVRDWNGLKLALWRSKVAWEITAREAGEIIDRCGHMAGCPGKQDETEPCLHDCPDRELRMSALVILNAARMFAPLDARKPADAPYSAPSREYFSEVIAALGMAQLENEALREALHTAGVQAPSPSPNATPALLTRTPPRLNSNFEETFEELEADTAEQVAAADDDVQLESEAT
jgi:hypothetical protein